MLRLKRHLGTTFRPQWLLSVNQLATTAASKASPDSAPFAIEDSLVATCGLTRDRAVKASKLLSCLKSPSRPDAVLSFLSGVGLSPSEIASTIARQPKLLCRDVETVLAPRLSAVQEKYGLSNSQIARFVLADPSAFCRPGAISKLQFYIPFFGSFDNLLLAMKKRPPSLLGSNLEKVKHNISLLSEHGGLSAPDISKACLRRPGLLYLPSWRLQAMVAWVDSIGVPRGKPMFRRLLQVVAYYSKESITARMKVLREALQWSDSQVISALCRTPSLLTMSDDRIQRISGFLISEAELDPKYIVGKPELMTYSLEGRLMPRFYVMKFLKEQGLLGHQRSYYSAVVPTDKNFVERFISPYMEAAPHIAEDYAAACRGQIPSRFRPQEPRTGLASV